MTPLQVLHLQICVFVTPLQVLQICVENVDGKETIIM